MKTVKHPEQQEHGRWAVLSDIAIRQCWMKPNHLFIQNAPLMWTLKALTGDWADLPVLQRAENLTTVFALGDVASTVDGWNPGKSADLSGRAKTLLQLIAMRQENSNFRILRYEAGGFVGYYTDGTFTGCSFDSEKNSGLAHAGTGDISAGVEGR